MVGFIHDVTIRRVTFDDTLATRDAAGQPLRSVSTVQTKALVQPRSASQAGELPDSRSAGAELADYVVFLPYGTEIAHADAIDWGDRRLQVEGIRPFAFGRLRHLEVDANVVTAADTDEGTGS